MAAFSHYPSKGTTQIAAQNKGLDLELRITKKLFETIALECLHVLCYEMSIVILRTIGVVIVLCVQGESKVCVVICEVLWSAENVVWVNNINNGM